MLITNVSRSLLSLFIFILLLGNIRSQEYVVTIWSIPVGTAEIQQDTDDEITFKLKSNVFIDYVFPISLEYYSKFDKTNHTVIENKKTIEQGKEEQNYETSLNKDNFLVYNKKDSISLAPNTYSLLSLLVKIMNSPVDSIDTKWFNLENESILYETRLLWSDTTNLSINNDDILCDHYRLDLKILDDAKQIFDKTDYFNELFFDINSIRQIWVEKWQKQQRIIKLAIKNNLVSLSLTIKK
ncbi:MAG: hypothetical protein V3R52_07875 [Candidatus Neomarinimicrobiota bacterium]